MKNFFKFLFFSIVAISTLIAISSMSWVTSWIALEINLLSIMPLMTNSKNKFSTEAAIKYFIVQAMASGMLLFAIMFFANSTEFGIEFTLSASLMVSFSLLLKMGAAPFHFWLPEVISGLNWETVYIILTWQKIAPMVLLSYSIYTPMFMSIIIIVSSMIGGLQGLNQTCLRKILTYSSINHISWMISAILSSTTIWSYYFIIYSLINLNILVIFSKYNIYYIKQLSKLFSFNKNIKIFFLLNFLSLGGLPPFLGFLPKWLTMNHLIINHYYTISVLLIIFTLLALYFYLRVAFSSFTINTEESLLKIFKKISYFQFAINLFSLIGLITCTILVNFI